MQSVINQSFNCLRLIVIILILIVCFRPVSGQEQLDLNEIDSSLQERYWGANWISHPTASRTDWGIFHFRRSFELGEVPRRMVVHVSADNRYRLFVNGREVVHGPARDDLDHWRYESVDLSSFLQAGKNVIAAVVWNFGIHRPVFQASYQTAFLLRADEEAYDFLNTGKEGWKVYNNEAYSPEVEAIRTLSAYHVTGPGERLDAERYPWGWEVTDYPDESWQNPLNLEEAHPAEVGTIHAWGLQPRTIPLMESRPARMARVRRTEGIRLSEEFLSGAAPVTIPANSSATMLFDQGQLINAYPVLSFGSGAGSELRLTYAESLYQPDGGPHDKGHRDRVEGKIMKGQQDVILPDGGEERSYQPLWFRTYRYLQLEVTTGAEPLTIHDLYGIFTGYPFEERAQFSSDDESLRDIWNIGWHTARLCAGETYYDCPYYEQLQYVGDTRIQALISLYVSGDDRLVRQAIDAYDHSRESNGLTHSRYPEGRPIQFIPTYSLFWVSMVYDYWMHRGDLEYVASKMHGIHGVLNWFEQQLNPELSLIDSPPFWNFVDWAWSWDPALQQGGMPPMKGGSSILTLQYIYTLEQAAELSRAVNGREDYRAGLYEDRAHALRHSVYDQCWDEKRKLLADTPEKTSFSQHANILGILTDAIPPEQFEMVMHKTLEEKDITQATFYFQFYLFEALYKIGWGDRYTGLLQPWREMLDQGLTTFAEEPDPTRSDCHAWSASPNYHFLSLVCGIRPAAPDFRQVHIEPELGPLQRVEGTVPLRDGVIRVSFEREGTDKLKGVIELPEHVSGHLHWQGKEMMLRPGRTRVDF